MAGRTVSVGSTIRDDALVAVHWLAFGDPWLQLQIMTPTNPHTIEFRREQVFFSGSGGAGGLVLDYQWRYRVRYLAPFLPAQTFATVDNPWRSFIGRYANTVTWNELTTHRLALCVETSTEAPLGTYAPDASIRAYVDDVLIGQLTGLTIPGYPPDVAQPVRVFVWADVIVDRVWVRPSAAAPSTTADGALSPLPTDLLIYDECNDLIQWPLSGLSVPNGSGTEGPFVVAGIGAAGTTGWCYAPNATPFGFCQGSGPFYQRYAARQFLIPVVVPPPTVGPPACPVPTFAGTASGGVACPAPVLP